MEIENSSNGIRPSSSSSMVMSNGNNHQALRNAFSHNPLNTLEKYLEFLFFLYQKYFLLGGILEIKIDLHREQMEY
jgi:hypothetical protein